MRMREIWEEMAKMWGTTGGMQEIKVEIKVWR